jgi:hypothetical protein
MAERGGANGDWTVDGPNLTEEEVRNLPADTAIEVVWSGGNGPHRYTLIFDAWGDPHALSANVPERMRYYNPLDFVGVERFHTRVRKVDA